jgi:hypothetical protein
MIESEGIDFIQDLPRFLVLLLALQRFTLADWGFNTKLRPSIVDFHHHSEQPSTRPPFNLHLPSNVRVSIDPNIDVYRRYGLIGRCTHILSATSQSLHPVTKQSLANTPLVVKIYWPNKLRVNEVDIINRAKQSGDNLDDHLPNVVAWQDDGYCTDTIRAELGIESVDRPGRVLRLLVFERLDEITTLEGEAFVKAWLQCVKCEFRFVMLPNYRASIDHDTGHYIFWEGGARHQDISEGNLLVRRRGDDIFGVLNDWDLSFLEGDSTDVGERTATIPFLALDLLNDSYWDGKLEVLYRHDLESFIWILVWALFCYDKGEMISPLPLRDWLTGDHKECYRQKLPYVADPALMSATQGWIDHRPIAEDLLVWLHDRRTSRNIQSLHAHRRGLAGAPEDASGDVLASFLQVISKLSEDFPLLKYLGDEITPTVKF